MKPLAATLIFTLLLPGCSEPESPAKTETVVQDFDIDAYLAEALVHLKSLSRKHNEEWRLGEALQWDADQETGIITWTFPDGMRVEAPFQIVGTYNHLDSTFLWGWDHPSVAAPLRKDAEAVLRFAKEKGIDFLQDRKVECAAVDAWELAALATLLCERQGAYRGPAGTKAVFMTFGEPVIKGAP